LVLGGDDITVIVRADLALPFARHLLEYIEEETKGLAAQLGELSLPKALTACAGIAVARAGLPFLTMNALAESLCSYAKKRAKAHIQEGEPYASLLAFHVQTQTAEEDYGRDIAPGLEGLTGNPYRLGGYAGQLDCPEWTKLLALASEVHALRGSSNSLRRIKNMIGNGRRSEANDIWHRLFNRTDRSADALLQAVRAIIADASPNIVPRCGAIFDALELIDLGAMDAVPAQERGAA
jgi:hypothetical protein